MARGRSKVIHPDEETLTEVVGVKAPRKNTRTRKIANGDEKVIKDRFAHVEDGEAPYIAPIKGMLFSPIGANQKRAMQYMREGKQVVSLLGCAGSGKSILAAYHAAELLKAKKIDKIYLARANVPCGKSNGSLPGDIHLKSLPLLAQTLRHLEKFLGTGYTKYCVDKKLIEIVAVEYMRGTSFEDCVVIFEESQALTFAELEMVLTRIGKNSQIIFTGDEKQTDTKNSGLVQTMNMIDKARKERPDYLDTADMNELIGNIGVVKFTFEDIQRSGLVKAFTKLYFYSKES